jgi:hypothetical protein
VQVTASKQPVTDSVTINSLNAIDFDGTDDVVRMTTATFTNGLVSVFMVMPPSAVDAYALAPNNNNRISVVSTFDSKDFEWFGSTPRITIATSGSTNSIIGVTAISGGEVNAYFNGSFVSTGSVVQAGFTNLYYNTIGNNTTEAQPFDGPIAEVIILDRIATTEERQNIEGYLANKWGLRHNLPHDHPYKWDMRKFGGLYYWGPNQITTEAWYDAADVSTITESAGAVSQWDDLSGNTNDLTQGTGSAQPSTGVATIGDLNAILFDGTDDDLRNAAFSLSNLDISVFMARRYVSLAGRIIALTRPTQTQGLLNGFAFSGTTEAFGIRHPENVAMTWSGNTSDGIVGYVKEGNNREAWLDGVSQGTRTGSVTTWTIIQAALGSQYGSPYANAELGEVIILGTNATTETRQNIEGYLAWKYGLEGNLPSDHPHKSAAPTVTP